MYSTKSHPSSAGSSTGGKLVFQKKTNSCVFQAIVCPTIGLDCHSRYHQNSSCPVACEGVYADARHGWESDSCLVHDLIPGALYPRTSKKIGKLWLCWERNTRCIRISGVSIWSTARRQERAETTVRLSNMREKKIFLVQLFISCQDPLGASSGAHLLWQLNLWQGWEGCKGGKT